MMKYRMLLVFIIILMCSSEVIGDDYDDDTDYNPPSNYSQPYDCVYFNANLTKCSCKYDLIDCTGQQLIYFPISINLTHLESLLIQNSTTTHRLRLSFANNQIEELKPLLIIGSNVTKIGMINLAQNKINKIDDGFFAQIETTLETLDLSENNLKNINTKYNFTSLKILKLDKQESQLDIDEKLFDSNRFSNLKSLDLRLNQLKITGNIFKSLTMLKELRLDSNNLNFNKMCASFSNLKSLETLSLNGNSLKESTYDCFKPLNTLTTLYLNNCSLDESSFGSVILPSSSEDESSLGETLQILDIKQNNFKSIPYGVLIELKKLISIKMNINEETLSVYKSREDITRQFENIDELDLSGSTIKKIPAHAFEAFKNMKSLIISNSNLREIDFDALQGLKNLEYLDLSQNGLVTFNSSFNFSQLNGNFNLQSNNFTCDCSLKWLIHLKIHNSYKLNLKCKMNARMLNINEHDFQLLSCEAPIIKPKPIRAYVWGGLILIILIGGIVGGILYLRHQHVQNRNRQYRYRFFSERLQEDAFDGMIDVPVYRDTTVSLQLKDSNANLLNENNTQNTSRDLNV